MIDWVLHSIEIFKNKPELNLIIRIHPAEIKRFSSSRQPLFEEIIKAYPELPDNVHVIKNNDKIETSALAMKSKSILIYGSKAGIEFSALGKRIIVCGESWIKNKGFSIDPKSKKEYESLFDNFPESITEMTEEEHQLAITFANYFFDRTAIYIPEITSDSSNIGLIPHKTQFYSDKPSDGLSLILDCIKNRKDFAYD